MDIMRGSLRLVRVTSTFSKPLVAIPPFSKCSHLQKAILSDMYLSLRQTFSSTSPCYVRSTLPDELARSIPRDSKQRRVDTNTPLPSAALSYWKQISRDKEEKPYQKFSTAQPTRREIPFQKIESPEPTSSAALRPGSPVPFTESLKPLEECHTFPATTAEDWRAIEAFIDRNAAMRIKEAVEEEAGTPFTKQNMAIVNDLTSNASRTPIPPGLSANATLPKPKNAHTVNTPTYFNRKFSTSVPNNWAAINNWIREAATQTAMKRRIGLGEDISTALAPLTREELAELTSALGQASPPTPPPTMESAKILDLPPLVPTHPKNIHTVNPILDGQFSTSETIKIGQMTIKVLEDGSRTENRMSVVLITLPPGTRGAPMKFNEAHDEGFLVVKGKVRFTTGRYLDADRTAKTAKAKRPENKDAKAVVDSEAAVHLADVGATSTSGDLLVPNKDMLEDILHAGARRVNVNHVMGEPEMDNEGISVDVDVKWGGWVTVPRGAKYTFSNPFEEEAEMLNTFTPGGNLEEMRRMSEGGKGEGTTKESTRAGIATKTVDDGGS